MQLFGQVRERKRNEAEDKFLAKLEVNPYYPFTKENTIFTYKVRDWRLWLSIAGIGISLIVFIVALATGNLKQSYFLVSVVALIFAAGATWTFKDTKTYILDDEAKMYTFKSGNKVIIRSGYHNVYIRLRKKRARQATLYYLIFGGYRLEKQVLTGTSSSMLEMRHLGQQLAANLGINYFDESNVSVDHVVRHEPPLKTA
ncbi:hypothetical protein PAPYR_8251 [Paratrimastix pyriformis]|uniref:DUF304 domain-containing protein n=1 Tax=Paratrimastix pyriformis TaxID=342808 RepID=A0ABQ8UFP2_9EUKA|nr:hypothetical protein PAPYR_8251 [Paratrimastix pyriformis]